MGTYNLPTGTQVGDGNHAVLHNQANTAVNDLDTRVGTTELGVTDRGSLFIPATHFAIVSGTPDLMAGIPITWPRWRLDPASQEIVGTVLRVPLGWATCTPYLWWSGEITSTGNVVWQFRQFPIKGNGDTASAGEVTSTSVNVAAPAAGVLTRTAVGSAFACATADPANRGLLEVSIRRLAADANDTYGNDAAMLGIELVKAS